MIITYATADDLEPILALERDGFAATQQWSRDSWAAELAPPDQLVLCSKSLEGELLGVATFTCVEDTADLNRVVVHPGARGRGIGTLLVRAGLEWAEALGATRMLLEVRTDNASAVSLYRRLGFDQISHRANYYGPGSDALVMLRRVGTEADAWAAC